MKSRARSLAAAILLAALLVNLVSLGIRIGYASRATFNSDSATTSLYAEEILKTRALFPTGWHYNNGDAWLYNHTLLAVPLLELLPNGYGVYAISTGIASLLILGGVGWSLRSLGVRTLTLVATIAVLASGISSPFIAELLFDWGATYGSQLLIACLELVLLAGISVRARSATRTLPAGRIASLCVLVFISAASNPVRAAMFHFVPYLLALGVVWMIAREPREVGTTSAGAASGQRRIYAVTGVTFALAFVLGAALHRAMVGPAAGILAEPPIYGAESLPSHVAMILTSTLVLFGYPAGTSGQAWPAFAQLSPAGMYYSARIVVAVALLTFPILFLSRVLRDARAGHSSIVTMVPAIGFGLALAFHVIAFRYPRPDDYTSIRYLFVPLLLMGVAWVVLTKDTLERHLGRPSAATLVAALAVLIGYMDNVYPSQRAGGRPPQNPAIAVLDCLEREGLEYGYAGFWSANVLTILSDSRVRVRPVGIGAQSIDVFPAHSTDRWYDPAGWRGKSFLLLSEAEARKLDRVWLQRRLGQPARTTACGTSMIIEFPYNVATRLFGNATDTEIDLDASTPHQVGQFDAHARTMRSATGEAGYLVYGPYMPLKKGAYEATVRLSSGTDPGSVGSVGTVDVVAAKGRKVLARLDVEPGRARQDMHLPFIIDFDAVDLEIRVHSTGRAALEVHGPIDLRNTAPNTTGDR